jgi:diphthamide biosynthesis protein 3
MLFSCADDDVDLDEMEFDESLATYFYPCPCGDRFSITVAELEAGDTIARCPSCSLVIRVLYEEVVD